MTGTNQNAISPLVSIIMNCFNSSSFLDEAIESVLKQTYQNFEVIFWDNQSTDQSAHIFKNYNDPRLKYFFADNHTVLGEARNLAVEKATGEWLAFLDCDDIWVPSKLEDQIKIITNDDQSLGLVYGQVRTFFSNSENLDSRWQRKMKKYQNEFRYQRLPEGYIFDRLIFENFVPLSAGIVRRDIFRDYGGVDATLKQCEDYDLFLKIAFKFRIRAVNHVVALYRVHDKNISISQKNLEFKETIEIVSSYLPDPTVERAILNHCVVKAYNSILERNSKGIKEAAKIAGGVRNLMRGFLSYFIEYIKRNKKISSLEIQTKMPEHAM